MEGVPLDGRFSIFTAKRLQGAGGTIVKNFLPFAVRSPEQRSRTDTDLRWGFDYRKVLIVSRIKRIAATAARSSFSQKSARGASLFSRGHWPFCLRRPAQLSGNVYSRSNRSLLPSLLDWALLRLLCSLDPRRTPGQHCVFVFLEA
jgi:hypothetical protein